MSNDTRLLAACRRCFAAPFADRAINDREDRGVSQFDVVVSTRDRASRHCGDSRPTSAFAPTPGDCAGYVLDNAELLRLAVWAVAAERNHVRHQGAR